MDGVFYPLEPYSYDLIMADPPWRFETYSDAGKKKSPDQHYQTMSLNDVKALPVSDLAAPHCLLWLWTTNPCLPQALEVMESWGFRYSTAGTWVKLTKTQKIAFGTGYLLRGANEPFLIGVRGNPKTVKTVRSVVAEIREHSRKPDAAYDAAELLLGPDARRADLFSRETRLGWDAWGAERGKYNQ